MLNLLYAFLKCNFKRSGTMLDRHRVTHSGSPWVEKSAFFTTLSSDQSYSSSLPFSEKELQSNFFHMM